MWLLCCSFFSTPHSSSFFSLALLLPLLSATQRVYVIFWLCVPKGDKKLCRNQVIYLENCEQNSQHTAQQTMQGGKTRLPPLPPSFPFPSSSRVLSTSWMCEVFFAASTSIRTSIPLKWHLQFPFTCHTANQLVAVETFTWRMRNQLRWQRRRRRRWLMRFAADLSTSWLMENANMKLSKN